MSKPWSEEEIYSIHTWRKQGFTVGEIAKSLNRTYKSVERKLHKLRNNMEESDLNFEIEPKTVYGDYKFKNKKTYIFSTIVPGAKVDVEFFQALKKYSNHKKSELVLLPSDKNYSTDSISNDYKAYIPKEDELPRKINNNLFISEHSTNVNLKDPISGLDSIVSNLGCLIVPATRHRSKMVPRMLKVDHTPRAIWCTGSITEPYYKKTKTGSAVKHLHTMGALIVEVINNETFFVRQLTWDGKGFYDLDKYCTHKSVKSNQKIKLLNMADDHVVGINPKVRNATKDLIKKLKPSIIMHHDTLDCASISHHLEGKHITKANINMTLEQEAQITAKHIDEMVASSKAKHYLVASNHPEHLDRYLDECRYRDDAVNHILALELALEKAKGGCAVECLLKRYSKLTRFKILTRKDSFIVDGIEQSNHGDEGSNGSRGSSKEVGLTHGGKVTTGHTHQAEIGIYNNYVNGTMTYLSLGYTRDSGSSSWVNSHTLQYNNGTRSQYFIMPNGKHILGL